MAQWCVFYFDKNKPRKEEHLIVRQLKLAHPHKISHFFVIAHTRIYMKVSLFPRPQKSVWALGVYMYTMHVALGSQLFLTDV